MMFEFQVAYRYLKSSSGFVSLISWFSFFGIVIGVATLIIVMSVMNGFRLEFIDHIIGVGGHIRIFEKTNKNYLEKYDDLIEKISAVDGVISVAPVHNEQAVIMSDNTTTGVYLSGIRYRYVAHDKPMLANGIKAGSLDDPSAIALGVGLADDLGVSVGDVVTVISPKFFTSIAGVIPNMKDYTVGAIFELGMSEYDSNMAYMDLGSLNVLFDASEDVAGDLEVVVSGVDRVKSIASTIARILPPYMAMRTWMDSNSQLMHALNVERAVMFLILMLIVIVAAFNIISGLVILAQDRKYEIAILKTMGASNLSVVSIFIICGTNIGILGTAVGTIVGVLFASNIDSIKIFVEHVFKVELFDPVIYFFSQLPSVIYVSDVLYIALISCAVSLLAAAVPAFRVTRYSPAILLRSP